MQQEQTSYRVPEKLLVDRDAIILGKLSLREAGQWLIFFAISYSIFSYTPFFDFTIKLVAVSIILLAGYMAIHQQFNGLTGYEWIRVWFRYRRETNLHFIKGTQKNEQKIVFNVKGGLTSNVNNFNEAEIGDS
jgi:hypothetical protein